MFNNTRKLSQLTVPLSFYVLVETRKSEILTMKWKKGRKKVLQLLLSTTHIIFSRYIFPPFSVVFRLRMAGLMRIKGGEKIKSFVFFLTSWWLFDCFQKKKEGRLDMSRRWKQVVGDDDDDNDVWRKKKLVCFQTDITFSSGVICFSQKVDLKQHFSLFYVFSQLSFHVWGEDMLTAREQNHIWGKPRAASSLSLFSLSRTLPSGFTPTILRCGIYLGRR